ncbi:LysR substrate-binding domain-containing protein [Aquirhabdus sp.]|uniref:LysR substrate-binding domain-containing protein n=1 Tax=Aquirhabdus sp. TaxID=2824160 RepID=UPI00396C3DCA
MQDLNDLFLYVQVVDHRGFAPAGRALDIPKSKLSRRIAGLEERLGVRLVQRSTRHFSVTEIGQEYYRHCVAMLVEAEAAQEVIERTHSEPQGLVRISAPSTLVYFQVGEMIAKFMAENPRVQVHLESTNRRVDVIREGLDIALRVRFPPLENSDLVMKCFGESHQRLVANPQLLAKFNAPLLPLDLNQLPSLDFNTQQTEHIWCLEHRDGQSITLPHSPRFVTDDMVALRFAAIQGIGVVQLPLMVVQKDIREGRLIEVLPDWVPRSGIIHAVFPSRRGLLPSVRSVLDFLEEEFKHLETTAY